MSETKIKQEGGPLTFKPANNAMELHCDVCTEVGCSEDSLESAAEEDASVHCDVSDLCARKREGSSSENSEHLDTNTLSQSHSQDPGVHVTSKSAIWGTKTANIKKKAKLSDDATTEAPIHLNSVFLESLATPSSFHPKLKEQVQNFLFLIFPCLQVASNCPFRKLSTSSKISN